MNGTPELDTLRRRRLALAALRSGLARELRQSADLSQADVAEPLQVRISTISRWERGLRVPRGDKGRAYLDFVSDLLGAGGR